MPGFDDALERLITDPAFAAALAADPDRALAGYTLSPDETALLRSQISTGTGDGGHRAVEARTSQSSVFGLFGEAFSAAADLGPGGTASFGDASSHGFGAAPAHAAGLGSAPRGSEGFGPAADTGLGPASSASLHGTGPGATPAAGFGAAPTPVADGYRTRVDADGDGTWDPHSVRSRPGGGVEILVDRDGDGRTDFTGHDTDTDGLIDHADYDTDHDGTPDHHLTDTNNDGWLDTRTPPRP
ncbi:Os1348 family NHLP clan protein [Catenuloplanes atrovinosus]|uniref:Uncharacterized protein n=1 Tax=Catenuloplanes atrovinosus TaxID=137266 RepID=A0AAE3YZ44_9ACTN|nr:Os1348 family NHLP clan protein [Catenuloplanes atrovinosus]MDR7280998.1 hypothetical protein [Catenuloplanes atrovinosus]